MEAYVLPGIAGIGLLAASAAYLYARAAGLQPMMAQGADRPRVEPTDAERDRERRREAKRFNEHLKLTATFLNGAGISIFITVGVTPQVAAAGNLAATLGIGLGFAFVLHGFGHGGPGHVEVPGVEPWKIRFRSSSAPSAASLRSSPH